jgi:hypothetical protein
VRALCSELCLGPTPIEGDRKALELRVEIVKLGCGLRSITYGSI